MRLCSTLCLLALAATGGGCATTELADVLPANGVYVEDENPVFIPLGKDSYGVVFENVLRVLGDYGFQFEHIDRYCGCIETKPRVSPGLGLFLKPGSPEFYERALATAQSYRHRVSVRIHPADQGGYFIDVTARKELEDLSRPIKSTIGSSLFSLDTPIDRDFDVIDPNRADAGWIYKGRDCGLEQKIIARLK
jgi:hypothetical protein